MFQHLITIIYVIFRYSDQSTSSSTISLRANNDSGTTDNTDVSDDTRSADNESGEPSASNNRSSEVCIRNIFTYISFVVYYI